jgi:hypothetical protein
VIGEAFAMGRFDYEIVSERTGPWVCHDDKGRANGQVQGVRYASVIETPRARLTKQKQFNR